MKKFIRLTVLFSTLLYKQIGFSHYLDDNTLFVVGSTSVAKLIDITKEEFQKFHPEKILVRPIGSDKGIISIGEGVSNIGIISRFLTKEEQKQWPNIQQITIGQDLIVFFVNRENSTDNLSSAEIIKMYTGEVSYWPNSNNKQKIFLTSKNIGHGTHDSFLHFFNLESMYSADRSFLLFKRAGMNHLFGKAEAKLYSHINQAIGTVFRIPSAIGYDSLGAYKTFLKSHSVADAKLLTLDDQAPIINDEINTSYTFKRPLNILINKQNKQRVKNYIEFLLSPKGQNILLENHFIPITH